MAGDVVGRVLECSGRWWSVCLDLGGDCGGGCMRMVDLLDLVASGEFPPMCGDCGVGIEGSCGLLHVVGETGGGEEWPNACAAEWWCGATVGNVL